MASQHNTQSPKRKGKSAVRACDLCQKLKIKCLASPEGCRGCKLRDRECTYRNPSKKKPTSSNDLQLTLHTRMLSEGDVTAREITLLCRYFYTLYGRIDPSLCMTPVDLCSLARDAPHQEFALAKHLLVAILGFHLALGDPSPSDETIDHYERATALIPSISPASARAPLLNASLKHAFQCACSFTKPQPTADLSSPLSTPFN